MLQAKTEAPPTEVTERLCETIVALSFDEFPAQVIVKTRQLILDGVAVAVAGALLEPAPRILADYFKEQGGTPTSTLLGFDFGLPPAPAALVNGASMHVLDFEPIWKPSTHALSPALAAVLPLAETLEVGGQEIVQALVKGIEIQGWIRQASLSESRDLRFHPPGVVGPIGAVVAAADLLDLTQFELANAIGIVSSRCGGLFSNLGTMTKSCHCGYAAATGVEAALLASRGFTGNTRTFDVTKQGFAQAFLTNFDKELLLRFGKPYRIVDPGYAIKIFPAKFSTHYGITAALELHPQIASPEDIASVAIVSADVPSSDRPNPTSGLDGKFSVQYTVAAALLDGEVGLQTFTDERLFRPDMQALLKKTRLTLSQDMSSQYDSDRHTEVVITLTNGSTLSARCAHPRGSWGAEPITEAEHLAKVRSCLELFIDDDGVKKVIELGSRFQELDTDGVRTFISMLGHK